MLGGGVRPRQTERLALTAKRGVRLRPMSAFAAILAVLAVAAPQAPPVPAALAGTPRCHESQLRMVFNSGQGGLGELFGVIGIRNTSRSSCLLAGTIEVSGRDRAGRVVVGPVASIVARPGAITPRALAPSYDGSPRAPRRQRTGVLPLTAHYRDDPENHGFPCDPHHVIPARWRVKLEGSGTLTAPNSDPAASDGMREFKTCRGQLEVLPLTIDRR